MDLREQAFPYKKAAKSAPAKPRPRTGSSMPAPDLEEDEDVLLELPVVAVPVEEPAAEPVELATLEAPEEAELLREAELTVLLLPVVPLLEPVPVPVPVAMGTRVVWLDGVPAGLVAAACWEVMTEGWVVTATAVLAGCEVATSVLTGGWPVTTPRESVSVR